MKKMIHINTENSTIQFAGQELERYIDDMHMGGDGRNSFEIKLGLFSEVFPGQYPEFSMFDDEIHIDI